jgi:hypothetical protein
MDIAALITWILTAGGGFVLLGIWLQNRSRVGVGAGGGAVEVAPSRLPAPVVFGHFLLAAVGLVLWIVYLANDSAGLAWTSFVLLVLVALGGFLMFARWLSGGGHRHAIDSSGQQAPENKFPLPVVLAHGGLGAATLIIVLLAAIDAS